MIELKISDFNITDEPIPEHVVDMIYKYHFFPLDRINECTTLDVYPSAESCYRPRWWEIARGRSGESQHCFGQRKDKTFNPKSKGACDITCRDFKKNSDELLHTLLAYTGYTRLCVYDTFIHGDYKHTGNGIQIFKIGNDGHWEFVRTDI